MPQLCLGSSRILLTACGVLTILCHGSYPAATDLTISAFEECPYELAPAEILASDQQAKRMKEPF